MRELSAPEIALLLLGLICLVGFGVYRLRPIWRVILVVPILVFFIFSWCSANLQLGKDSGGRNHLRGELYRFGEVLATSMADGATNEVIVLIHDFDKALKKGGADAVVARALQELNDRAESETGKRSKKGEPSDAPAALEWFAPAPRVQAAGDR